MCVPLNTIVAVLLLTICRVVIRWPELSLHRHLECWASWPCMWPQSCMSMLEPLGRLLWSLESQHERKRSVPSMFCNWHGAATRVKTSRHTPPQNPQSAPPPQLYASTPFLLTEWHFLLTKKILTQMSQFKKRKKNNAGCGHDGISFYVTKLYYLSE